MSEVSPEWAEYFADPPTGPEHPTQAELEALAGILEMPFVDYDAYQIIAAYRRGLQAPRRQLNQRVVQCDTVTIHKYTPGQDLGPSINVGTLSEELTSIEVGGQTHVRYSPDRSVWVYGVAWDAGVAVYRFEAVTIPAGSNYQVGPFPLVFSMSDH